MFLFHFNISELKRESNSNLTKHKADKNRMPSEAQCDHIINKKIYRQGWKLSKCIKIQLVMTMSIIMFENLPWRDGDAETTRWRAESNWGFRPPRVARNQGVPVWVPVWPSPITLLAAAGIYHCNDEGRDHGNHSQESSWEMSWRLKNITSCALYSSTSKWHYQHHLRKSSKYIKPEYTWWCGFQVSVR